MTKKLSFSVSDINLSEDSVDTSQFSLLVVDAFATGVSAHETFVTEETLRKTATTILQKPFVFAIDKNFDDLSTHTKDEVAGGFVPHNTPITFKTLEDGRTMMTVNVLVWKRYSGKLLEYFKRDENKKSVSVEIEVYDSVVDPITGLLELKDFCYNAITALGDFVRSAIPNAQAVLQFSEEFALAKNSYIHSKKYESLDFSIPNAVISSAKQGLEFTQTSGKSATSTALSMAKYLSKNKTATPEKIKAIAKYFERNTSKTLTKESREWAMWQMYGGNSGRKWSSTLVLQMKELDEKQTSYFSETDVETVLPDNYVGMEEIRMTDVTTNFSEENLENKPKGEFAEDKPKDEKPVDEFAEDKPKEEAEAGAEDKPKEEKKFSLDEYVDVQAMQAFLAEETEDNDEMAQKIRMGADELAKGKEANMGVLMSAMFAKMCKMSEMSKKFAEDIKVHMAEKEELKKFKADKEAEEKQFTVDKVLFALSEKVVIPEESLAEMRSDAEKYSFAQLGEWETFCKAKSFDFAQKTSDVQETEFKYAAPYTPFTSPLGQKDLWN